MQFFPSKILWSKFSFYLLMLFSQSEQQLFATHGLQHARLPCPSPSPRACSNSCPSIWWCHPIISSSVVPFSSRVQSFPAQRRVFSNESAHHIRWPKYWSFSFSISLFSEYSGMISFKIGWVWFPCCPRDFQESSSVSQFEALILWHLVFYMVQQSYPYMTTGKTTVLTFKYSV